ncbi:MAG: aminopeptidase P family protein [Phocaeicola sp.]
MKQNINNRISALRHFMKENKVAAFIIPSSDPHASEYTPTHWESRQWLSGFTGSAGTMVVTHTEAALWTDSRYYIQAENELEGAPISLFKEGLPHTLSITTWLGSLLSAGDVVGIDGWVNKHTVVKQWSTELGHYGISLEKREDPFASIWSDRPSLPQTPLFIHEVCHAGYTCQDKLDQVREAFLRNGNQTLLLTALDEIAWLLNLRGNDIPYNPVFISYLLINEVNSILFIDPTRVSSEVKAYLAANKVAIRPYHTLTEELRSEEQDGAGCMQLTESVNEEIYQITSNRRAIRLLPSPVMGLKAIKNPTEIAGFRNSMAQDGAAMVRFIQWIKKAIQTETVTEVGIDKKLYELRSQQRFFVGESFPIIAGYQENGAIVHHHATPEKDTTLQSKGLLLLDSGAHYLNGTTDITRTLVLGETTPEQKLDYTLVLKGMINLSLACFPHGTCGTQLDALARLALWKRGMNYGHGTGHGVGYCLNVHEGPHQFRMNHVPAILLPGMTITNEPGVYKVGSHGIRIENTMLIVPAFETAFGKFYQFEPLTLCPIDTEAILLEELSGEEIEWLNQYHTIVYKRLSPLLTASEQDWLKEATSPLTLL